MAKPGLGGIAQAGFYREVEQSIVERDMRQKSFWVVVPYKRAAIEAFMAPKNRALLRAAALFQGITDETFVYWARATEAHLVEGPSGLYLPDTSANEVVRRVRQELESAPQSEE